MGRHVWSEEVKAEALALLADPEKSFYEAREATGVPASQICAWALAAGVPGRTKAQLLDEQFALASKLYSRLKELCLGLYGIKDPRVLGGAMGGVPVVYFVSYGGGTTVKIGTSRVFPRRLADLRYYSPVPLAVEALLPGGFREEKMCHQAFEPERLHGEWFDRSEYLDEFIGWIRGEFGAPEAVLA